MLALIPRVALAEVRIGGTSIGRIDAGPLVLLCAMRQPPGVF